MTDDLHRREAANRHLDAGDDWPECWPDASEAEPGWEGWAIAGVVGLTFILAAATVAGIWSIAK